MRFLSVTEFSVSTRVLQNEQMAGRSNHGNDFKVNAQKKVFRIVESIITKH